MMKNLANKIVALFFILLIVFSFSCDNDDSSDGGIDIGIDPESPYNSPIWHPSGQFIGFNHTPLKRITYPDDGENWGHQEFEYDSTGFWLINPDGTNMRRIFPHTLHTPSWSPDGEWIAFVSDGQIFKMRYTGEKFDTTTITQLTSAGRNFFPDWSPDGQWIVYDSNNESLDGGYRIWEMDSNGNIKSLIIDGRMPDWSVDSVIVYIGLSTEIYQYTLNDSNTIRLSDLNIETNNQFDNSYPKLSSGNGDIIFLSQINNNLANIYIIDSNGANLTQLTKDGVDGNSGKPFSMSPDGKYIVYTKYNGEDWSLGNGTLWILDIYSGTEIQLTYN